MRGARALTTLLLMGFLTAPAPRGRASAQQPGDDEDLGGLSLEQLLSVSVVSASNTAERLTDAPATVIVVTRQEMIQRGYTELSELLDDLPGMDVVRPYGATYLKNYWRGYRNTIGDPFLLLVDGIVMNHLYFNTTDVLVTVPLSNIERVEVVYGPASSVYGANAFMGVINVITSKERPPEKGSSIAGALTAGSFETRIADLSFRYVKDDLRVSLTARIDDGVVDPSSGERYEYTKARYYQDRRLWGGFVDNPNLGGAFDSHHGNRAIDLRLQLAGIELGVLYNELSSGYGLEYPADKSQNDAVWARPDLGVFMRTRRALSRDVTSTTLLRYRRSDVSNDSIFSESYSTLGANGRPVQVARLSYWQALDSSWSLFQDFDYLLSPSLSFTAGLKYERKDLQKAYDISLGPALPVSEIDASRYPYPAAPTASTLAQNRIATTDVGVYLQTRYRLAANHQLNFGLRSDHNSKYGTATTLRAGYVGTYGRWGAKALYGEAFQEPNPRLLYGGWTGSGSDPNLLPERSRTIELSGTYTTKSLSSLLSVYAVRNADTIVNTSRGAENLGDREVFGFDVHVQALVKTPLTQQLRFWAFYSRVLRADERKLDAADADAGSGSIGDLARERVILGVTSVFSRHLTVTLRGRWVGPRTTVATNPVREVSSYATMDATVLVSDFPVRGIGLSLKATNVLDEEYFHPGVRDADAGTTPGSFDANGAWSGSRGYYSSLLPQPGRAAFASLTLGF